jgi:hypothetical protein
MRNTYEAIFSPADLSNYSKGAMSCEIVISIIAYRRNLERTYTYQSSRARRICRPQQALQRLPDNIMQRKYCFVLNWFWRILGVRDTLSSCFVSKLSSLSRKIRRQ